MKYATIFTALLVSLNSYADKLEMEVRGNVIAGQSLMVGVWNNKVAFDTEKHFLQKKVTAIGEVTPIAIDLPPGRYAIGVYVDSNESEHLEFNLFGMPEEMYGFSNDARNHFSPPEWSKASFGLGYGVSAFQSIHVRQHLD